MQYEDYKVEDFLFDEFFVRWVKNPGPETDHFWNAWLEKNKDKIQTVNAAREIINSIGFQNTHEPSERDYNEVLEHILKKHTSWTQIEMARRNDRITIISRYAAVVLVIFTFIFLILFMKNQGPARYPDQVTELVEKHNPNGLKTTFKLPDGTIVKLNAGSKLIFDKEFTSRERKVTLEGEAFFDVKHDESRPFIVETHYLTTIVLGTSFNIKSYPEDEETSVAVASGKVKVVKSQEMDSPEGQYYLLNKNQMVTYNLSENSITKRESIPANVFSWKDNIIHFDRADFSSVIQTLTRWYGVDFVILSKKSFAGRFNAEYNDEPLELVLEGLKGEYDFEYRIDGKKVYIY